MSVYKNNSWGRTRQPKNLAGPHVDTSGTAVTIQAANGQAHKIYEIAGVDRVYFKIDDVLAANDEMFAAGSTFQGS